MKIGKWELPQIGWRMLKSTFAVFLCFLIEELRGSSPFYASLAALQTIQPYKESTKKIALQRVAGTLIGAIFGLITILLEYQVFQPRGFPIMVNYFVVSAGVCCVLYTSVLLHKKSASYFSCVVYLSITMIHLGDSNPYLFVLERTVNTFIGVGIGILINQCQMPRKMPKNVLFASGLDNVLLHQGKHLSDFSKIRLNRMIDDGMAFTMMTMRTPASLLDAVKDVRLQLPVIVMNGAALYDVKNNQYVKTFGLNAAQTAHARSFFAENNQNCFVNTIDENTVMIHYQKLQNEGEKTLYTQLRKSPYRNYTKSEPSPDETVVYLMAFDEKSRIVALYEKAKTDIRTRDLQLVCYDSIEYPHFALLKVFHPMASKQNMLQVLKQHLQMEQSCTLGSVEGSYDVVVSEQKSGDEVVHLLEKIVTKYPQPIKMK